MGEGYIKKSLTCIISEKIKKIKKITYGFIPSDLPLEQGQGDTNKFYGGYKFIFLLHKYFKTKNYPSFGFPSKTHLLGPLQY